MRAVPTVSARIAVFLAALSLACSPNSQAQSGTRPDAGNTRPVACTMMFAMIGVRVADSALRPVSDAQVTVVRKRTGETRTLTPSGVGERGVYTIVDDSMREALTAEGEPFEVTARAGGARATASYTIGLSEGGCHVAKLAGPETLVLR